MATGTNIRTYFEGQWHDGDVPIMRAADHGSWLGTNDLSSFLTVPAAIDFQKKHNWDNVRNGCSELLGDTLARIRQLTGEDDMYPAVPPPPQLGIAKLPAGTDPDALKAFLFDRKIEIPITGHQDQVFIRVSVQGYNDQADYDRLLDALQDYFA